MDAKRALSAPGAFQRRPLHRMRVDQRLNARRCSTVDRTAISCLDLDSVKLRRIVAGRYLSMPPINGYISHFILTGKRAVLNLIMA